MARAKYRAGTGGDVHLRVQADDDRDHRGERPQHEDAAPQASRAPGRRHALRVVWPASNSSQRPLSSSPRSKRVLVSSPQTAPRTIRVIEILNTVKPATVCRSGAGPNRALVALFEP